MHKPLHLKAVLTLFCFVVVAANSFSQLPEQRKFKYFKQFDVNQKQLIKANWTEFFKEDIAATLDNTVPMFQIRYDSYGAIYPEMNYLRGFDDSHFANCYSRVSQLKYSLYALFRKETNRTAFLNNVPQTENQLKTEYESLFKTVYVDLASSSDLAQLDTFLVLWNKLHEETLYAALNKQLEEKEKVLFFTHGFNVPYSLAVIQAQTFYNHLKDSLGLKDDLQKTLFVPIYWPSGSGKAQNIDSLNCKKRKCKHANESICKRNKCKRAFSIENFAGIFNGGLLNKKKFGRYSKHTYCVGLSLRKVLLNLENPDVKVYLFAHSLGATIATASLISPVEKMGLADKRTELLEQGKKLNESPKRFEKRWGKNKKENFSYTNYLVLRDDALLYNQPLNHQINVFLSAPAIPGTNTFQWMNRTQGYYNDLKFYSTMNIQDPMLTKSLKPLFHLIGVSAPYNQGATSLGCNFNGEAEKVERFFRDSLKLTKHFFIQNVQLMDHDVFLYLEHIQYRDLLYKFMLQKKDKPANKLTNDEIFKFEYAKINNDIIVRKKNATKKYNFRTIQYDLFFKEVNQSAVPLRELIYTIETDPAKRFGKELTPESKRYLLKITDPYMLFLFERAVNDDRRAFWPEGEDSTVFQDVKQRILEETHNLMHLQMKSLYPYYTYETTHKKVLSFISLRVGNDLFVRPLFIKNFDRDYTGSLMLEFGTDYLNPGRRRPIKSYQTFFYGFDVFTPQFNDSTKFKEFNSFDSLDRPHASFQYIGWSKKGLSRYNYLRWSTTLKVGVIGSKIGEVFQTVLHQDVSYSLRPRGWDAQIAKGGRLGFSFETKHEYQFKLRESSFSPNSFLNVYFVPSIDLKFGTYMTNGALGIGFTNKKFAKNNHNFINFRHNSGNFNLWDHLMYSVRFSGTYVVHNTMLEGYGILRYKEYESDSLTPKSVYRLQWDQVKRMVFAGNVSLSYTARNFTLFYNFFIFSPETKLGYLYTTTDTYKNIDLGKRWHSFAEIGATFNLH